MGENVSYNIPEADEKVIENTRLRYFNRIAFEPVLQSNSSPHKKAELFALLARFNTLYMVARAGSGHLGSSFSSLDIVTWLYLYVLKSEDRYFSSKGHDSPGLYAVQAALGIIPFKKIHALRRLGGLPGHPDINTPGAHTNTGSLGMGVSKAKGFLFADDLLERSKGRIFVLTGDGELQEGQFWESLITASRRKDNRLTIIVDHNKLQSDTYVSSVNDLGDLEAKFNAFGWDVHRCDGHNFFSLEKLFGTTEFNRPKAIIADTIKGRGVSFMEHTAMAEDQEYYCYHSGALLQKDYRKASEELLNKICQNAAEQNITLPIAEEIRIEPVKLPAEAVRLIPAYTQALLAEARSNSKIVALDADLILDTGLIPFKKEFSERFIECGIAEQDMVSQAGTMALVGLIPVVHSFACFLTSRASEQIYNNCTQGGRLVYVGSLAGVLPGGPGHSHQAIRDITAMSAMPGITIVQPISELQVKQALHWAITESQGSTYLRLVSVPFQATETHKNLQLPTLGQGVIVREGNSAVLIVSDPILLTETLKALEDIDRPQSVMIICMPWLNRLDVSWFIEVLGRTHGPVITLENHSVEAGFGSFFSSHLACIGLNNRRVISLGVQGIPVCGSNVEVLAAHQLNADFIKTVVNGL